MGWPVHMKVVHREKERANAQDFYASEVDFVVLFVATVFSLCDILEMDYTTRYDDYAPESILVAPADVLQVAHAPSSGCLAALCLLAPLVRPKLCRGVTALRAGCERYGSERVEMLGVEWRTFVLPVESTVSATTAEGVCLGVSLTVEG